MKKTLSFIVSFILLVQLSFAATTTKTTSATETQPSEKVAVNQTPSYNNLSTKQIEVLLGRKLTVKEKVGLFLVKKHIISPDFDPILEKRANSNALLGFIFSLLGLLVFPLFSIPGLILSNSALRLESVDKGILKNGNHGLAMAGKIISIITIALYILVIAILVAALSHY